MSRKKSWLWVVSPQDLDSMDYWHPVMNPSVTVCFDHVSDEKGVYRALNIAMAKQSCCSYPFYLTEHSVCIIIRMDIPVHNYIISAAVVIRKRGAFNVVSALLLN
eukprot:6105746-Ditylum_brightwellii.AAC.1